MANNNLETTEKESKQYIVVMVGSEQYGIDISYIDNIVRMQKITRVPKVQTYFKGVINLRGEVVPVMSVRKKMGLEDDVLTNASRIIILKLEENASLGVIVDEVREVVNLSEDEIDKVSNKGRFINGIGKHGDQLISLLEINALVEEYYSKYDILLEGRDPGEFKKHVAVQAAIEIGFEQFLEEKNYQALVTHFGDLGALKQLPGLAIQRLMEKGYGFGAEGDWKTAAMVRLMKIMTSGMKNPKGTSFMEDYTYNLVPGKEGVLQSHMLEVCPTIADGPVGIKVCPLSMGNREDPA